MAIAAGRLPPRPWDDTSSPELTPERAARLLLSHAMRTPEGPLLFLPTTTDPFSSGFTSGDRFSTAVTGADAAPTDMRGKSEIAGDRRRGGRAGGAVEVGVRVVEVGTSSTTMGAAEVADRLVYVDGAR